MQTRAEGLHLGVVSFTFHAAVPAIVVVRPVPVLLAVSEVVLAVVAVEIAQGEAVVAGQEIHRGGGLPTGWSVEIG